MDIPPQGQIIRVRPAPPGARPTTHMSAAAVGSVLPSYRSGALNRLTILQPGRETHHPAFCQEWLIHRELWSHRKGAMSLWQRWSGEWSVWPRGGRADPYYLPLWGDIHI